MGGVRTATCTTERNELTIPLSALRRNPPGSSWKLIRSIRNLDLGTEVLFSAWDDTMAAASGSGNTGRGEAASAAENG